jgi:hypothetical protein
MEWSNELDAKRLGNYPPLRSQQFTIGHVMPSNA